ncbi:protein outspread-like [Pollicipes pollicipes]|uniref:protein outspread-like n=1 Tax=Pollicipes pollicipes TaxID=41117 RepID=UPI001884C78E|nr:protein outspread-like [Pollicipes pollicipes]
MRLARWQRRWFVLYDDGELTYSVDDHPETVPHGVIDMSKVMEVADAEDVTGNSYSIALTAPDRVTFIKGTCRDESRWWIDALHVYTTMVKGRHKRNATFPGGRSTTVSSPSALNGSGPEPFQTPPVGRRRLLSCQSEPMRRPLPATALTGQQTPERDPPPPADADAHVELKENRPPASEPRGIPGGQADDKHVSNPPTSESPPTQDRCRSRRLTKQARAKQGRARSETIAEILQTSPNLLSEDKPPKRMIDSLASPDLNVAPRPSVLLPSTVKQDGNSAYLTDYSIKREEKLKDIADSLTRPRPTRTLSYLQSIEHSKLQSTDEKPTRENEDALSTRRSPVDADDPAIDAKHHERGDPDGCGLDATDGCYSNHNDLRVDLPAEDLLRIKKGWLMKMNEKETWIKHWFVLRGPTLTLYRDTAAEDNNVMDGVIDLSRAQRVEECDTDKNYGFQITTWDGSVIQLSAMTSGIRGNWIQALRGSAHLPDAGHRLSLGERLERQLADSARKPRYTTAERDTATVAPAGGLQATPPSSDEEYRTASETSGGLDEEEPSDAEGRGRLAGSPPPARGPLSRAKDRARSRSTSSTRSNKRSRSSPPTSRRNTREDFPCMEELSSSIQTLDTPGGGGVDSPFKRSWRLGRESLRSSLRPESMLSDRLDARETYTSCLDRSKLRSSLRTMPTEPPSRGDPAGASSRELTRLRHRLDALEVEKDEAERDARRATAAEESRSRELTEWRTRASSLEQQLSQLLQQLQRQERELAEKTEQLQQLQMLETRYHDLLDQYEEVQAAKEGHADDEQWRRHYEKLEERYLKDHADWEQKLAETEHRLQELLEAHEAHAETDRTVHQLTVQLRQAEAQMRSLADQVEAAQSSRQQEVRQLREDAAARQTEMCRLRDELEAQQTTKDAIKQDKSEVYKLKDLVHELRSLLEDRSSELEKQRREAREARQELVSVRQELETVRARLQQGIEENEALTARVRELRNNPPLAASPALGTSRERFSSRRQLQIARIASLSDLTAGIETDTDGMSRQRLREEYDSLLERFEKAVSEIRALKRQLREVQGEQDRAELEAARLASELEGKDETHAAEAALMRDRLQDLTAKLAASEKQARQLKQKMTKGDARDRRRTSSLKGRESFSIPLELEAKLAALEARVAAWDGGAPTPARSASPERTEERAARGDVRLRLRKLEGLVRQVREQLDSCVDEMRAADLPQMSPVCARLAETSDLLAGQRPSAPEGVRVLVERIHQLLLRKLRLRELLETHRRVGTLRERLQTGAVENVSSGMVESFSALLAERLGSLEEASLQQLHQSLLKQEAEVTAAVAAFKADKLQRLAETLAAETVLSCPPPAGDDQLLEEVKVRDAWNMAQHSISEELVQAEMSHMMLKFVELYERDLEVDRQHCFFLVQAQQEAAERRYTVATESLRAEMEEAVMTLSRQYEAALSDRLLAELADVVAQKAIVDGYLSVISDEDEPALEVPLEIIEEDPAERSVPLDAALHRDSALAVFFGEAADATDQAELQHLYAAAVERCRTELSDYGVAMPTGQSLDEFCRRTQQTVAAIRTLEREVESLRRVRVRPRSVDKARRRVSDITGMVNSGDIQTASLGVVCQELVSLKRQEPVSPKCQAAAAPDGSAPEPCHRCGELRTRIDTCVLTVTGLVVTVVLLSTEHTSELKALRKVQDAELEQLRREMTSEVNKVTSTYEREKEALASEVRLLRRRLESLEAEYEAQISALRDQYETSAGETTGRPEEDALAEESIRRRYQAEIEQLRALCEKGLVAMENSHRRIIAELEEKHRRELHSLEAEKQQALAEETQATLAALDALRKAHETEVQREICKFKDEFIKKMQPGFDIGKLQKEHVAEMGDIKGEILSLSEKYSIKCLETASLEEKVDAQHRSLQQANQRVFQLDARNKQLRAQLSANISELADGDQHSAGQQLALAENQLAHSREEAQRLHQELETTQKLSTYLRAERQLRADEVSSLRDRLEHIILTASKCEG